MTFLDLFRRKREIPELVEGRKHLGMGLFREAARLFGEARTRASGRDRTEILFYLAVSYYLMHDRTMAVRTVLELLERRPSERIIWRLTELLGNRCLSSDAFVNAYPSFSRDGKKIAFSSAREDTNNNSQIDAYDNRAIYVINRDGTGEYRIVDNRFDNSYPSFSPKGDQVVFLSRRDDTYSDGTIDLLDNAGIYIVDADGKNERCIIPGTFPNKYPVFSPDGKKIAFISGRSGRFGLYMYDLATRNESKIGAEHDYTFPTFSPDGRFLLYASWKRDTNSDGRIDIRDNSGIYVLDLYSGRERLLVSDRYDNSFPTFSPDGSRVMYLSRRRDTNGDGKIDSLDNCGIYVIDTDGRNETCLVNDECYNKFASWSYDGKKISFLTSRGGEGYPRGERGFFSNKAVYTVKTNGKDEKEIVSARYQGNKFPLFSPTSSHLIYLSWRTGTNRGLFIADSERLPTVEEFKQLLSQI